VLIFGNNTVMHTQNYTCLHYSRLLQVYPCASHTAEYDYTISYG